MIMIRGGRELVQSFSATLKTSRNRFDSDPAHLWPPDSKSGSLLGVRVQVPLWPLGVNFDA